jgi:hypothetical protein
VHVFQYNVVVSEHTRENRNHEHMAVVYFEFQAVEARKPWGSLPGSLFVLDADCFNMSCCVLDTSSSRYADVEISNHLGLAPSSKGMTSHSVCLIHQLAIINNIFDSRHYFDPVGGQRPKTFGSNGMQKPCMRQSCHPTEHSSLEAIPRPLQFRLARERRNLRWLQVALARVAYVVSSQL